jgi:hypothetical protein
VWLPLLEPEPLLLLLQGPQPPLLCLPPPLLAAALCLLRNAWLFFPSCLPMFVLSLAWQI